MPRKAEAKLIVAKEEGKIKIFKKKQETHWTFQELTDWFMEKILPGRVIRKGIKSPKDIESRLRTFNQTFGHVRVSDIKLLDLQNYQANLKAKGLATGTIDNRNESRGNKRFKVVFH